MGKKVRADEAEELMLGNALKPIEPFINSHSPWRCICVVCNREVSPSYHAIRQGQGGCAYCSGRRVDLAEVDALLRSRNLEPLEEYVSSSHKWKCKCLTCGEVVFPKYDTLRDGGGGCRKCGYERARGKTRNNPVEAEQLMLNSGFRPLEPYRGVSYPWKSECLKCNRTVTPSYANVKKGSHCAYCVGARVDISEALNLLEQRNLKPLEPFKTVMSKWKCECLICGDQVSPSLNSLKRGQGGCKRCGYLRSGESSRLNETKAISIMREAGVEPLEPYKSSKTAWKSKCMKCSREVSPRLSSLVQGHGACVYCAGMKADFPEIEATMLKNRLKPLEPYKSAKTRWKCECLKCGDLVFPQYNSLQQGQGGCKKCAASENALNALLPEKEVVSIMLSRGFQPLVPYPGGVLKWKSQCLQCNNIFYPNFFNVRSGSGCPTCSKSSYDPNKEGYLYFIEHNEWDMYQIGITNHPDDRLKTHKKLGWSLLEIRGPIDGHLAQELETAILRMLRINGADLSNEKIAGKFTGYSEAWSKPTYVASSIKNLISDADEMATKKVNRRSKRDGKY